jgi:hypothetical protein
MNAAHRRPKALSSRGAFASTIPSSDSSDMASPLGVQSSCSRWRYLIGMMGGAAAGAPKAHTGERHSTYRPLICPTGQVLISGTPRKYHGSQQTRMATARGQSAPRMALPRITGLVALGDWLRAVMLMGPLGASIWLAWLGISWGVSSIGPDLDLDTVPFSVDTERDRSQARVNERFEIPCQRQGERKIITPNEIAGMSAPVGIFKRIVPRRISDKGTGPLDEIARLSVRHQINTMIAAKQDCRNNRAVH